LDFWEYRDEDKCIENILDITFTVEGENLCDAEEDGTLRISISIAQGEGWEELQTRTSASTIHGDKGSGNFFFNGEQLSWDSDADHPESATAVMELKLQKCPSGKQEGSADIWLYADQEWGYGYTDIVQIFKLTWSYECCGGCCALKSFDANVQRTGNDPGGNLPKPGSDADSGSGSESN